jgi:hypothetical protein
MPTKRNPVAKAIMEAIEDGAALFWEYEKDAHFVIRRRTGPKRSRIIHRVWGTGAARRLHSRLLNLGVRPLPPGSTPPEGVATIGNAAELFT